MRVLTANDLRCPVTGKRAYADEKTCVEAIERAWRSKNWQAKHGQMPKRAYHCEDCGWWHMTSRTEPLGEG
jgi:hypothetical protein